MTLAPLTRTALPLVALLALACGGGGNTSDGGTDAAVTSDGTTGTAMPCTITWSGAVTETDQCFGNFANLGSSETLTFEIYSGPATSAFAVFALGASVTGQFTAKTYSTADLDGPADNNSAQGGQGYTGTGTPDWSCNGSSEPCAALSLTLTSVDMIGSGASLNIGPCFPLPGCPIDNNIHGTLDVTIPPPICVGGNCTPAPNLTAHVTF